MKKYFIITPFVFLLIVIASCAKMGSLTGGYKDELPPVLLDSKPVNYSVNFKGQKIELVFDEFVVLKNVNQELVISPPLPKKPDVRIKNKSILIDLKNELRENTTYTLNFGKAIADNNEGNPLTNFEFVFSTGQYLDSLSVKGTLLNSFNLQPSKEAFIVGLYDQPEDSVPIKNIPVYIGKTDAKGLFRISNIKADTFKLFALKDLNYNLLFDLPNEEIAFTDSLLLLTPEFLSSLPLIIEKADTSAADTTKIKPLQEARKAGRKSKNRDQKSGPVNEALKDSTVTDSIVKKPVLPALFVDLFYFLEDGTRQYMTNNDRLSKEKFQFSFSLPLENGPIIEVLEYDEPENWYLPEVNAKRDTFTYWITDTTLINSDSLKLSVFYPATDSMGVLVTQNDTIKFITRKAAGKPSRGKNEIKTPVVKLDVSTMRNNGVLEYNSGIPFTFSFPLEHTDTSCLHLFALVDSIEVRQNYDLIPDTINLRRFLLHSNWKEKVKYRIQAIPGAFNDIYQHTNDSLLIKFSLREKSYYGILKVSLTDVKEPILVELMNEKEQVLRTKSTSADASLVFDFLPPAKYKLKFVYDLNENQKWDTGGYLKKIQPEKVLYYVGEINIRSNWELEVKQDFGE